MAVSLRELGASVVLESVASQGVGAEQVPTIAPGLLRKASSLTPVRELEGPAKVLSDLSTYLSGRHQSVVRMMDEAVRTGSPEQMLKVTAAMIDNSAESDLLAKTVGKTVSAVDQLTKLS